MYIIYQADLQLDLREILEIKNSMNKLNTRLDRAKDKISKFENKYAAIILSIAQGGKDL